MKIRVRATFSDTCWQDEEDEYPTITHGYTDPRNPWGGFTVDMTDDGPDMTELPPPHRDMALSADEWSAVWDRYLDALGVDTITFESATEAAEFLADFPGGIWDYRESEPDCIDYRTGTYREVTAHVEDHEETVFAILESLEARNARALARRRGEEDAGDTFTFPNF